MRTINEQRHRSLSKAERVWAVSFWERTPFLFPFLVPLRCLRLAAARQILSFGTALALLGLAVPNAVAQQFASRNPDKDIVTSGIGLGNKTPRGIWVDEKEEVLLVLDFRYKKIFTYCFDTGRRLDDHHNDRVAATEDDIEGDEEADGIYKYGEQGADGKYGPIDAGPDGIRGNDDDGESDDQIIVNADDFFLFKTNAPAAPDGHLESKKARDSRQYPYGGRDYKNNSVSVLSLLPNPYGIWSDGSTLWVSDFTDGKIYAYDLSWHLSTVIPGNTTRKYAMGTRNSDKDFAAYDENTSDRRYPRPQGIWANGTAEGSTMWVADSRLKKIFAYDYNVTKGTFQRGNANKDIGSDSDSSDPGFDDKDMTYIQGIWSDGETMWVASETFKVIYAYNMWTNNVSWDGSRVPGKDIPLSASNRDPRGIWANETTMWVSRHNGRQTLRLQTRARSGRNGK